MKTGLLFENDNLKMDAKKEKNSFFAYTDRIDSYCMINACNSQLSDGLVKGTKTLIQNLVLQVNNSLLFLSDPSIAVEITPAYMIITHNNYIIQCALYEGALHWCFVSEEMEKKATLSLCSYNGRCVKKNKYLKKVRWNDDSFFEHCKEVETFLECASFKTDNESYNKALSWARFSGWQLVTGIKNRGIWAGLPWFRDNWGRDTFIALPGILLATGQFEEARHVIEGFSLYQDTDKTSNTYGRIPNRYINEKDVIYNTADGSLWFIREVLEYAQYTGDSSFVEKMFPVVSRILESDLKLRCDKDGFLCHGDADTWMDARYKGMDPFSPRGNRANDIQALFYTALQSGAYMADILLKKNSSEPSLKECKEKWLFSAKKLKKSIKKFFLEGELIADCLLVDNTKDFRCRPNQLMMQTIPFKYMDSLLDNKTAECSVRQTCKELLFPYGICSLSQKDSFFHPVHDGSSFYHKDAAYHNGTMWGWNAGFTIGALCNFNYGKTAWTLSKNLCKQILTMGCLGSMSENLDAYKNEHDTIVLSGTWDQAWSVSEFYRNAQQDFLGVEPCLLEKKVYIRPSIPKEWNRGSAFVPLGSGKKEGVVIRWHRKNGKILVESNSSSWNIIIEKNKIQNDDMLFTQQEKLFSDFEVMKSSNYLQKIVVKKKFNENHPTSDTVVR